MTAGPQVQCDGTRGEVPMLEILQPQGSSILWLTVCILHLRKLELGRLPQQLEALSALAVSRIRCARESLTLRVIMMKMRLVD